jgi:cell division protein FtsI (penicillin-binding protein 3)
MATAALVNGGYLMPPTFLKRSPAEARELATQVIKPETSEAMRYVMRLNAERGSATRAAIPGYFVGGKTGTAEKVSAAGGYNRRVNVSTFAAAFPMDAPRYVVLVMMDAPRGNEETFGLTTAAWTAAPVVSRVISRTGPLLGIIPDARRDIDTSELMPPVAAAGH